jgi:hypothetical protein
VLDESVTLRILWQNGQLNDAKEYLRRVYVRYRELARDIGECAIQIGTTGTGYAPNYRIQPLNKVPGASLSYEAVMTGRYSSEEERVALVNLQNKHAAFSGRSHKRLALNTAGRENWSSSRMTLAELQALRKDVEESERMSRPR